MNIKVLIMDVDGTLTDGHIYMGPDGEAMKAFHAKDGYGIVELGNMGILPVIITGRKSRIVENRAEELQIKHLYQGVPDKLSKLKEILKTLNCSQDQMAYIGDDLNDLACIDYCGMSACPADAVEEVKTTVDYVCTHKGGQGAVREFIDYLRKQEGEDH